MPRRNSPRDVALAVRRNYALVLRRQGGSFFDIAAAMRATLETEEPVPGVTAKYGTEHARLDVLHEMKRITAENKELAEHEIDDQLESMRELWAKFYSLAVELGDHMAFDRCMAIMERRLKLLGKSPDAPLKVALTDPTGTQEYGAGLTPDERVAILRELFVASIAGTPPPGGAGADGPQPPGLSGLAPAGDA